MDELTLCRRIASGERQLFGRIIDQYSGLVAGVIASQGIERSEIEDLAQEAFINIYRGIANFRGDAKLSSWIYRIAFNVARQHLRKKATRPTPQSVEEAAESGRQPVDENAGKEPLSAVRSRALAAALQQLPVNQRTALYLYYFEELSYEEIREAMNQNLNTVRTHIRRGKLKLADLLDQEALGI
jgi:RNA polymerase sigma-70 factor (ECF subfamily)